MGDYFVDMAQFGWFPDRLPSEEGQSEEDSSDPTDDDGGDGVDS
jgi:methylated-DNA-protein-cysteine methyltransferase related protein